MAKQLLLEAQILALLTFLNPLRIGKDANPLVATANTFVLTGKKVQVAGGESIEQYTQMAVLSPEAKAANPNLVAGRYLRIMKTEQTKEVNTINDAIMAPRQPLADNLFENQNPLLFDTLISLLKKKDDKGNFIHFVKMEPDKDGNPRIKLLNPVGGAFVTLNMPPHYRVQSDGKVLSGASKDLATGTYKPASKIIFRKLVLFLFPAQFEELQSIAMNKFQKLVEPMLAEEIVMTTYKANEVVEKTVKSNTTTAEDLEDEGNDTSKVIDAPISDMP
jgi:hypothetical protein